MSFPNRCARSILKNTPICLPANIWTGRNRKIEARDRLGINLPAVRQTGMKLFFGILLIAGAASFIANAQPTQTQPMNTNNIEIADLGGGCFWCMEAVFERLPGVISVTSGFAGGHTANPTYQEVCTETTGHAEVVQIEFDPGKISYNQLLDVFWQAHDPTTLNRQGADVGTSYRSIILYRSEKQKLEAEKSKLAAQKDFKNPIVTQIVPLKKFYLAENYHQEYYDNNSNAPYCQVVITPKLEKLEKKKVIQAEPQTKQ
jgi:peptide-methionine (S)-S-oxide reductase